MSHWAHVAFLLAIALLGGALGSVRLATGFAIGQLGAVAVTMVVGAADPLLPELLTAVAVVLLAREALRAGPPAPRLVGLSAAAGLFHGLSLASALPGAVPGDVTWSYLLLLVLGMDAVLLALALGVSWAARLVARRWRPAWARSAIAYGIGATAVATAAVLAMQRPGAAVQAQGDSARLPGIGECHTGLPSAGAPGVGRPGAEFPRHPAVRDSPRDPGTAG